MFHQSTPVPAAARSSMGQRRQLYSPPGLVDRVAAFVAAAHSSAAQLPAAGGRRAGAGSGGSVFASEAAKSVSMPPYGPRRARPHRARLARCAGACHRPTVSMAQATRCAKLAIGQSTMDGGLGGDAHRRSGFTDAVERPGASRPAAGGASVTSSSDRGGAEKRGELADGNRQQPRRAFSCFRTPHGPVGQHQGHAHLPGQRPRAALRRWAETERV